MTAHRLAAAAYLADILTEHDIDQLAWQQNAACRGADTSLFFPPSGGRNGTDAKTLCARCTVRDACLDYALTEGIEHGIFGGVGEKERRILRTRHRLTNRAYVRRWSHGTETGLTMDCRCVVCETARRGRR